MTKAARKAGAKGASIPYEPRRQGVTRPAIQSLLLPSRSGPTSQAGRTIVVRRFGHLAYENQNGENQSRLHEIVSPSTHALTKPNTTGSESGATCVPSSASPSK